MQINFNAMSRIEGDPNLVVKTVELLQLHLRGFGPGAVGAEGIADPKVREAMKLALDYDGILDVTVGGTASSRHRRFQTVSSAAPRSLPSQDLEAAKALMAEAGYADGFTIEAMYPTVNVYISFDTMMQKVQQDAEGDRYRAAAHAVEFPQWIDRIDAEGIPVTAVYFAPDHTDSSQYVSYFGEVEGGIVGQPCRWRRVRYPAARSSRSRPPRPGAGG